ncbi:DUF2066 domain-containing protein [Arenimonas sp.]|uniref:DUF2066 domain-containing protein n=1 Tax=Arenimonas sp. TaxID=1872635 RepID=UPI0039E3766E
MRPPYRLLFSAILACLALSSVALAQSAAAPAKPAPKTEGEAAPAPKIKPMRDPALYKAEVTLTSQGETEREGATARALMAVIVKLTGNPQAPANPVIRRALSTATSLVDESDTATSSDSEGNTAVGGVPVYKTTMTVSFDPASVDALIAGAGLRYWTGVRPKPILWLAIDDGRGPRLVTSNELNVVRPLANRGLDRGLRFGLPSGTAIEQAAVNSIWNLDSAALVPLTSRYGNDTQLIGKMYRSKSGWSAWWVLSQGGVELSRWPVTHADPKYVISSGADPAADALAKRDSVYLDIGPAGNYLVEVSGVDSSADFLRLMSYLQTLAIVRRIGVVQADTDSLRLSLELSTGLKGLRLLADSGTVMQSIAAPPATSDVPATESVARFGLR